MKKFNKNKPYAFVDGSFNKSTNRFAWGGILLENNNLHLIQGSKQDKKQSKLRNVAGEINASLEAVELAIKLNLKSIQIVYDYYGIEKWATLEWKRNNEYTKAYANKMQDFMNQIDITFVKVEGHTNIQGNEIADRLAKQVLGIK